MKYLPSKKFFAVIFSAIILGGGILFFASKKDVVIGNNATVAAPALEKDADGDGLPDWKEDILGSDPKNPDSDNNGILDGEEYKTTKKYKEVGAVIDYIDEALSQGNVYDHNNTTESLFANVGFQYASLETTGAPATNLDYENIVNKLASGLDSQMPSDYYSSKNTSILADTTTNIKQYARNILVVFGKYKEIYDRDPLQIVGSEELERDAISKELLSLRTVYKEFSEKIISIPVPKSLVQNHINLANNLYKTSLAIENMSMRENDPIKSMLGSAQYISKKQERTNIVAKLTRYIANLN